MSLGRRLKRRTNELQNLKPRDGSTLTAAQRPTRLRSGHQKAAGNFCASFGVTSSGRGAWLFGVTWISPYASDKQSFFTQLPACLSSVFLKPVQTLAPVGALTNQTRPGSLPSPCLVRNAKPEQRLTHQSEGKRHQAPPTAS